MKDLVIYKTQQFILDDPFETLAPAKWPDSDYTWIIKETSQQLDNDLWECYWSHLELHSAGSSFSNPGRVGGDIGPETLFAHSYNHRGWRVA
jgi:hypothetical protein